MWKQPHPLIRMDAFILTIKGLPEPPSLSVRDNKRSSLLINSSLYLDSCTDHSSLIISKKHIISLQSPIFVAPASEFETALSRPARVWRSAGTTFPRIPSQVCHPHPSGEHQMGVGEKMAYVNLWPRSKLGKRVSRFCLLILTHFTILSSQSASLQPSPSPAPRGGS